jgi:hypothetical protein
MNTKVPEDVVRRAIELYDLKKPFNGATGGSHGRGRADTWDEGDAMAITVLSTYDDMAEIVPVLQNGFMVIWARVFFSYTLLKLPNVPCRYRNFSFYGENKKPRCEICGKPEQENTPLSLSGCRSHISSQ